MPHVPCCTASCPVQAPPCHVVHAHAYHCLKGNPLKTTFGYVVDLPATSIVQCTVLSYHLRCTSISSLYCCSNAGNKYYVSYVSTSKVVFSGHIFEIRGCRVLLSGTLLLVAYFRPA
jgi:hypothetical protein